MIYLVLALILFSILNLTAAAAARNLNTNIATVVINVVAVLLPLAVALPAIAKKGLAGHKFGLIMAVITGILVGFYALSMNKAFTLNKVGVLVPAVFGGTVFLTAVISFFLFKERLNTVEAVGLGLVFIGLMVIIYARAQTGYES